MLLIIIFILGYFAIASEQLIRLNKAASALMTGVLCWMIYAFSGQQHVTDDLMQNLAGIAGILFFLLGAMTIVELVDAHDGFEVITTRIKTLSRRRMLVIVGLVSFFLSAVLDNLTTAIVMMSLVRKVVREKEDRLYYGGMVIIAANAGGAFSPVGDVTTTMLWIGGQISSANILLRLILPSLVSLAIPMLWMSFKLKGNFIRAETVAATKENPTTPFERKIIFFTGLGVLILVPVFKALTGLPPFMGVLFGLAIVWSITEIVHKKKNDETRESLSVAAALQRIDTQSILFFLGILLAVGALEKKEILHHVAAWLDHTLGNIKLTTLSIGLASAVVDNVPLVAAAQGMYPLAVFPQDHFFWEFLAYCAGTGGSILIIGSAAGVAVMGIEKISFGWYLRKISIPALLGYFGGALVYIALAAIM